MLNEEAKVLYLIETGGPGGAERMLLNLACGLKGSYRPVVGLGRPGWLQSQFVASGVPCEIVRSHGWGDLGIVADTVKIIRKHCISLIHAHEFYMNVIGAAAALLTGVPLVCTVHGKNYYPDHPRRISLYKMVAWRAGAMVAVSRDLQYFFCQLTGLMPSQVRVIYNGVPLGSHDHAISDRSILQSIGIPIDSLLIGAIGNLYPVKGHIYLVRAMPEILQRHPGAHVVLLGRGGELEHLREESKALGVEKHIHLLGYREDTAKWLEVMDVYVQPSLNEGLPLALLEAMNAGVPVVVTAVGGMPEVVVAGQTGLTVAPNSSDELAHAIVKVLGDRNLAVKVGLAGEQQVRANFSLESMIAGYRNVYSELLAR